MPKNRVEIRTAPPHRDQEDRDDAHIENLVRLFVGIRDREFVEKFAHRLLSAVRSGR